MRTIYQAKDLVYRYYGKSVVIRVLGMRHKIEIYEGVISEYYDNIFILSTKMGKKSFTYSDILVGNIKLNVK